MRKTILCYLLLFATREMNAQNNSIKPPFHYDDSLIIELLNTLDQNANSFGIEYIKSEHDSNITYLFLFNGRNIDAFKICDTGVFHGTTTFIDTIRIELLHLISIKEFENIMVFTPPLSFSKTCKTSIVYAAKESFMILHGDCAYTLNQVQNYQRATFFEFLESVIRSVDGWAYHMHYERMY